MNLAVIESPPPGFRNRRRDRLTTNKVIPGLDRRARALPLTKNTRLAASALRRQSRSDAEGVQIQQADQTTAGVGNGELATAFQGPRDDGF
ncbi:hypothetical protein Enr13x_36210 [Stieleria neptunia]|uniref:Uncharacterized protein n=1 Tax=Stieleria neptunia TaxID=2527979 RepID=A0A518HSC7_9BACT|nr:hypothetical protein Enr13x_36210 [Stieleria neptunia]